MNVRPVRLVFGLLALVAIFVGCVPARGGWDLDALASRHRAVALRSGSRLADVLPHLLPDRDGATLFLCRWASELPIPVSLPAGASAAESLILQRALSAWEGAGLGVRFEVVLPGAGRLDIRFADPAGGGWVPSGTGDTITDCAILDDFDVPPQLERVAAKLSFASIILRRHNSDALGRPVPMSGPELLGAAVHELGHALGFAGHVATGDSVMVASTERVRQVGARLLAGEPLIDESLSALYALPPGVVVGRVELSPEQTMLARRLAAAARKAQLSGPFSRVGDTSARLLWRGMPMKSVALEVEHWPAVVRGRRPLRFAPNAAGKSMLGVQDRG